MTMLMVGIVRTKHHHGRVTFKARKILKTTNSKIVSIPNPSTTHSKTKKTTTGPLPPQYQTKIHKPNGICRVKISTINNRCGQPLKRTTTWISQQPSTTCRHHFLYKRQRQKIFNSHRISSDQIGTNTNHSKHLQSLKLS